MPVFGYIEAETIVQVGDRTRLFVGKSFSSKGGAPISSVKVKPESSESFVQVGSNTVNPKDWFLDWQFSTAGTKTVTLEIETNPAESGPYVVTKQIQVVTAATDALFSNDDDLIAKESEILKWTQPGRNSFLNVHREAQKLILNWLDETRVWKNDGSKLTKDDLKLTDDLRELSAFWTLALIYGSISNKVDDSFMAKSKDYYSKVESCKNRGRIQADFNGSGEIEKTDNVDMKSIRLVRR